MGITGTARAPRRGTARAPRRAAAGLACAAMVAAVSVAGCDPTPSDNAAATASASAAAATASASAGHACSTALGAVSDYGPTIIKDAIAGQETVDKVEIDLLVAVLKGAAAATGNPGVKQSITNLADDYEKLRDSLHGTVDAAVEKQVDDGAAQLKDQCESP